MDIKFIRFHSAVETDLQTGRRFYNRQENGVGEYFIDSLLADIESLLICAGVHTKVFGCYRLLTKRFPYAIYYLIDGQTVKVQAVLPLKRNPKWLKGQLTNRDDK